MKEVPMSFDQIKVVEKAWSDVVKPEGTVQDEFRLLRGEVRELHQSLRKGDRREILSECADVMNFTMAIMRILGAEPEDVLTKKWERNLNKYNMATHEELVESGKTHEQAREIQKFAWDRKKDGEYCI